MKIQFSAEISSNPDPDLETCLNHFTIWSGLIYAVVLITLMIRHSFILIASGWEERGAELRRNYVGEVMEDERMGMRMRRLGS